MVPPFAGIVRIKLVSIRQELAALAAFRDGRPKLRHNRVAFAFDGVWVLEPLDEELVEQRLCFDRVHYVGGLTQSLFPHLLHAGRHSCASISGS